MSEVNQRPTVREVAKRAGVSPMTVSRTLAGGINVRPELQQRVMAAVEELGYHRDENARSIRPGQTSGLIGVAITNIANPYYGTFALGVEEEAALSGRRILLGNTSEDPAREAQLVSDFMGRRVEGLIVVPTSSSGHHLEQAQRSGVPVVLASRRIPDLDVDSVVLQDELGAYEGTRALIEAGHRRIGYMGNTRGMYTGAHRFAGYARALHEAGLPVDEEIVFAGQQGIDDSLEAARKLLDVRPAVTAIFCANNRNAIGAAKELGRRISKGTAQPASLPEMLSFDDFELSDLLPVPVSVVDHDPREVGRLAAKLLLERLTGQGPRGVRELEVPVRLHMRGRRDPSS